MTYIQIAVKYCVIRRPTLIRVELYHQYLQTAFFYNLQILLLLLILLVITVQCQETTEEFLDNRNIYLLLEHSMIFQDIPTDLILTLIHIISLSTHLDNRRNCLHFKVRKYNIRRI